MTGFQTMFMPRPVLTREPPKMPVVPRERVGLAPQKPAPKPVPVSEPAPIVAAPKVTLPDLDFEELVRRVAERLQANRRTLDHEDDEGLRALKFSDLMRLVSQETGFPMHDLCSQRRNVDLVKARQIAMWLGRRFTIMSSPAIGTRMGGRDHTTVLHGQKRVREIIEQIGPAPRETPQAWLAHLWKADWGKVRTRKSVDQYWLFVRRENA